LFRSIAPHIGPCRPGFVSSRSWGVFDWNQFFLGQRHHGERKKRFTGRDFAAQTDVEKLPRASTTAPGWDSERVWSGHDDWEPFVAADRSSSYVYEMPPASSSALPPMAGGPGWRTS